MRHALVDEAVAMLPWSALVFGARARDLAFLELALAAVGEKVVGIARAHQPGAGEREGDAAGVDSDPAPAPLFGDIGGRAGAAGRVEHEVAGIGGHKDAALDDLGAV